MDSDPQTRSVPERFLNEAARSTILLAAAGCIVLYWFSLKWKIAGFELASKG